MLVMKNAMMGTRLMGMDVTRLVLLNRLMNVLTMVRVWLIPVLNKCGDGVRNGTEECDDGNDIDGDGCGSTCVIEAGYICDGGSVSSRDYCDKCGNGFIEYRINSQYCDDGNNATGDG